MTLKLDYVADFYHRYPGDTVDLHLRLRPAQTVTGQVEVRIQLPPNLNPPRNLARCEAPPGHGWARFDRSSRMLTWQITEARLVADHPYHYMVPATIGPVRGRDAHPESWAEVQYPTSDQTIQVIHSELVKIQVHSQANSVKYLPGIFQDPEHELMWRYMMVFDHVWAMYDELLRNQTAYFDPRLSPPNLQAWLASWVDEWWVHQLPKSMRERLISQLTLEMASLYQKRGTKFGLKKILQVCMGLDDNVVDQYITITENFAGNFLLDDNTVLGDDLRIGCFTEELCHFTVELNWPEDTPHELDKEFIEKYIIDYWKPTHAVYVPPEQFHQYEELTPASP